MKNEQKTLTTKQKNLGESFEINRIYNEDCLETMRRMPNDFVNCVVTSPPYWKLRDYGVDGQIGLEETPELYVEKMVNIFQEVKRILKKDGTVWLNLGDSYNGAGENRQGKGSNVYKIGNYEKGNHGLKRKKHNGLKSKDLVGIPWRVAFALQATGWYLRSDIIWHKPSSMPESVKDRPTKNHEYIFLLTKAIKYFYDYKAILEKAAYDGRKDTIFKGSLKYENSGQTCARAGGERWSNKIYPSGENQTIQKLGHSGYIRNDGKEVVHRNNDGIPARNKRTVWTVNPKPFNDAHFAVFPPDLIVDCIKAGCPKDGIVYDPFGGSGTTDEVALRLDRKYILSELKPEYVEIAQRRINSDKCKLPLFGAG